MLATFGWWWVLERDQRHEHVMMFFLLVDSVVGDENRLKIRAFRFFDVDSTGIKGADSLRHERFCDALQKP